MLFVIGISTHTEVQRAMAREPLTATKLEYSRKRELLKKADVWQR